MEREAESGPGIQTSSARKLGQERTSRGRGGGGGPGAGSWRDGGQAGLYQKASRPPEFTSGGRAIVRDVRIKGKVHTGGLRKEAGY